MDMVSLPQNFVSNTCELNTFYFPKEPMPNTMFRTIAVATEGQALNPQATMNLAISLAAHGRIIKVVTLSYSGGADQIKRIFIQRVELEIRGLPVSLPSSHEVRHLVPQAATPGVRVQETRVTPWSPSQSSMVNSLQGRPKIFNFEDLNTGNIRDLTVRVRVIIFTNADHTVDSQIVLSAEIVQMLLQHFLNTTNGPQGQVPLPALEYQIPPLGNITQVTVPDLSNTGKTVNAEDFLIKKKGCSNVSLVVLFISAIGAMFLFNTAFSGKISDR